MVPQPVPVGTELAYHSLRHSESKMINGRRGTEPYLGRKVGNVQAVIF